MEVLLVDDSRFMQERMLPLIEESNKVTSVYQVLNIESAKKILLSQKISVVITDIRMPGGNGFDLFKYIKSNFKEVKVIMMTNYPYPQYREKAEQLGVDYFLSKTDDLDQLAAILNSLFN